MDSCLVPDTIDKVVSPPENKHTTNIKNDGSDSLGVSLPLSVENNLIIIMCFWLFALYYISLAERNPLVIKACNHKIFSNIIMQCKYVHWLVGGLMMRMTLLTKCGKQ